MKSPVVCLKAAYICISPEVPLVRHSCIAWKEDRILGVDSEENLKSKYPEAKWLDYSDHLVLPGFVNGHEHGRGVGSLRAGIPDGPLEVWIQKNIAGRSLNPHLSALYNGYLMMSSGITTTMHFHRSTNPETLDEEIDQVVSAYRQVGMRVCVGIPIKNKNLLYYGGDQAFLDALPEDLSRQVRDAGLADPPPDWRKVYDLGVRLRSEWQDRKDSWLSWAPANLQWCTDDLLAALAEEKDGLPIQIHLVESQHQQSYGYKTYGMTPVARLNELGFLSPRVSCAHAVWLTDEDIRVLAETGAQVVHNPSSNLRLRNGICRALALTEAGVVTGLGLDGQTINDDQDMLQEIRLARALAFRSGVPERAISTRQVLRMATENGARILAGPEPKRGRLEADWAADFNVINLKGLQTPFLDERINPLEAVVSLAKRSDVDTVVVGGEIQFKQGKHVRLDLADLEGRIEEEMCKERTTQEIHLETLAESLAPYYQDLYSDW